MKYRKKPVVIEAFKYDGDFMHSNGDYYAPDLAVDALNCGIMKFINKGDLIIKTLEGDMTVNVNDYVIKGVNEELYPCKPDIFKKTYEKVE